MKPELSLLPFDALGDVAVVFANGRDKYGANNWMEANNGGGNHVDAALRHLGKLCDGEEFDEESGLSHAAHAAARILMHIGKAKRVKAVNDDSGYVVIEYPVAVGHCQKCQDPIPGLTGYGTGYCPSCWLAIQGRRAGIL